MATNRLASAIRVSLYRFHCVDGFCRTSMTGHQGMESRRWRSPGPFANVLKRKGVRAEIHPPKAGQELRCGQDANLETLAQIDELVYEPRQLTICWD